MASVSLCSLILADEPFQIKVLPSYYDVYILRFGATSSPYKTLSHRIAKFKKLVNNWIIYEINSSILMEPERLKR